LDECRPLVAGVGPDGSGGVIHMGIKSGEVSPTAVLPGEDGVSGGRVAKFGGLIGGLIKVGRCRLAVSNPELKAPMISALETKM
jgi:hypothetical protein